ncbi:MAG: helix-turn-helix domain-containing protein, partial [Kiritimatiellae bacterium]|nr:helix-turn-helix domain-containing protein [Kiritimatiellia bacterium]
AKQMTIDDRRRIDFLIQLGWTPIQIAEDRGRSKSTIIREIINRSIVYRQWGQSPSLSLF